MYAASDIFPNKAFYDSSLDVNSGSGVQKIPVSSRIGILQVR